MITRTRMRRTLLLVTLIVASSITWAQIPSGYYDSAAGKTGQELRAALHNIIKGHHSVGYGGLLDAYPYTDHDGNGHVLDIYSNCVFTYGNASQECGNYQKEGDCWNREHTWPQSWFKEQSTPRSDLFHVYPTDGKVNGVRSSYPYAKVKSPTYTSTNGSKLGTSITPGYTGKAFEPIDEYKGDIARSFFYMSTRYYTEDSGWISSEMTNKSDILDWAITMLLEWHKQDPVSQKEIDRNNVIYNSYQKNRNPFIDHPEYAEMIWDETWQEGNVFNITSATNISGGTVSAPYSAAEGATVSITATPAAGYEVTGYSAWKTGDTSTTVAVSSNGTFTMPAFPVTVSASFRLNANAYDITLADVANGVISASASKALSGTTVTLTATPGKSYRLRRWYVYKTGDMSTQVELSGNSFVMPAFDVTINAAFERNDSPSGTGDFVKVTEAPDDWSGEYLIVYEKGNLAFNGGLTALDATGNTISVSISNNTIAATDATLAATFTIAPISEGYSIQAKSGMYIGRNSSNNGLDVSQTPSTNTISYSNGKAIVKGKAGPTLQFNSMSDQLRFRYFSSNQQPIQLYKRQAAAEPVYHTITFHNNDGTTATQQVEDYVTTRLDLNTFTLDGYTFGGWQATDGTYYGNEAYITLIADADLNALWDSILGDINRDNDITIADVTALVNIILGKEDQHQLYNHDAADVNDDGDITIADVTALVNIILGKN